MMARLLVHRPHFEEQMHLRSQMFTMRFDSGQGLKSILCALDSGIIISVV